MRLLWIGMGFWVRFVILDLMRWTGCVWLAAWVLKILYRNSRLVQKPIFVATVFHLLLVVVFLSVFFFLFERLFTNA